jgi:hypothetical protein
VATLNGGFKIRHYKSSLTCIQIELRNTVREDKVKRDLSADDVAFARWISPHAM